MFSPLEGRSVVVTGATRGIGKGIARVFARAGTRVLVVGRDEQAARQTVDELSVRRHGLLRARRRRARARTASGWRRWRTERHGGIDVLCANAGIFPGHGAWPR